MNKNGEIKKLHPIEKILYENEGTFEADINAFITELKQKIKKKFDKIMSKIDECHKNLIQLAKDKVTDEMTNLKRIITDTEAQSQNLQKALQVLKSDLSKSIIKRTNIVKDNEYSNAEMSKIVVDCSTTLANSPRWKSDMIKWLKPLLTKMGRAYRDIPLPYIGDTAVTAAFLSKNRFEKHSI